MIEITLPWPPNVNHYKKAGRLVRTKSGKMYQARVNSDDTNHFYWQVWTRIQKEGLKSFHSATISVEVDAYPPDKRKRDIDGILKVLLDSMQKGGLYDDDYQIARLLVERKDIIPNGKVIVRISELLCTSTK
jgi:crossover junction endodeoxyribonuclease RusA